MTKNISFFLGIDPGVSGAFAVLNDIGEIVLLDSWMARHRLYEFGGSITLSALEKVHIHPGTGASSATVFMKNAGHWEGVLETKCWPYDLVTPQAWQKKVLDFQLTKIPPVKDETPAQARARVAQNRQKLKAAIVAFVLRRYPNLTSTLKIKKNWDMADAICLALYARSRMI